MTTMDTCDHIKHCINIMLDIKVVFDNLKRMCEWSRKREPTKKIEFFMLIKSYNLSQLSAKILEGKTFNGIETDS